MRNTKGFTFIETLIVIGIIALLFTAIAVTLNPAKRFEDARDKQREIHLQTIYNAIEKKITTEGGWFEDERCLALPQEVREEGEEKIAIFKTIGTGEGKENPDDYYNLFKCLVPKYLVNPLYDPAGGNEEDTHYQIWQNPQTKYVTLRYIREKPSFREIVVGAKKYGILEKPRHVETAIVSSIGHTTAVSGGTVYDDGGAYVFEAGVLWAKTADLAHPQEELKFEFVDGKKILRSIDASGRAEFTFLSNLHSLQGGEVEYYVRAYARNEIGVGHAENIVTFKTLDWGPEVYTLEPEEVGADIAKIRGEIRSLGVEYKKVDEAYFCWGKEPFDKNPGECPNKRLIATNISTEPFLFDLYLTHNDNLTPDTTYHFKACAYNSVEGVRRCGEVLGFTTQLASAPIVKTLEQEEIEVGPYWAKVGGNLLSTGGEDVTARGFCVDSSVASCNFDAEWCVSAQEGKLGSRETGKFYARIDKDSIGEDLEPGKSYYVCAYAENNRGTSFGKPAVLFTTKPGPPEVETLTAARGETPSSAVVTGKIKRTGGGAIEHHGVCWLAGTGDPTTITDPTTHPNCIDKGYWGWAEEKTFSVQIPTYTTGLWAGTAYNVSVFAINEKVQEIGWGEPYLTLAATTAKAPKLTTIDPFDETRSSVKSGGDITDHGGAPIAIMGVCWSEKELNANPQYPATEPVKCKTVSLINLGKFDITVTEGLYAGREYAIQAFARNKDVAEIGYGGAKFFKTKEADLPTITATKLEEYGKDWARITSTVTEHGGDELTVRGVCYSSVHSYPSYLLRDDPDVDCFEETTKGVGSIDKTITGLDPEKTYYFLAFAHNSAGTVHGEPVVSYKISTCKVYINGAVKNFDQGTDPFEQCPTTWSCEGKCARKGKPGYCNGAGACEEGEITQYAPQSGLVCFNNEWTTPSASAYCDIAIQCYDRACTAERWYRGCLKDTTTSACTDTGRVKWANNWNASPGYASNETKYKTGIQTGTPACSQTWGRYCAVCKLCGGGADAGKCTWKQNTKWGAGLYGCAAGSGQSMQRCYAGVCRTCGGYLYSDGCSGCAGQGSVACWYKGGNNQSCTTVCGSRGCVVANWNDNKYCDVCKHFWPKAGSCFVSSGTTYLPCYRSSFWEGCKIRPSDLDQDCTQSSGSNNYRICICNY